MWRRERPAVRSRLRTLAFGGFFVAAALVAVAHGRIETLDRTTGQVFLDDGSQFTVGPHTEILVQGKKGRLADLREGDQVQASYQEQDSRNVAISIIDLTGGGQTTQIQRGMNTQ